MSYVKNLMSANPDTWQKILIEDYKIIITVDGDLASLKYNQIESPMSEPIVQECRGMVVRLSTREIVAWPYNKFWNMGESRAAPIDWASARVMEKLDGSLMIVYWDTAKDDWAVASSGHPTAGGRFGKADTTFAQAFWKTWLSLHMLLPDNSYAPYGAAAGACFIFEFCDTPNRIVVKHEKPRIVLHGARWNGGTEFCWDHLQRVANEYKWELVKSYPLSSAEDCLAAAEVLNPVETEGYVVVDKHFNRVKIKSPRYVALHHMKGDATPRRAIQLWQSGETDELLLHFPEFAEAILPVQEALEKIAFEVGAITNLYGVLSRKEFALKVKDLPYSSACFKLYSMKDNGVSYEQAKQVMRSLPLTALEGMIKVSV